MDPYKQIDTETIGKIFVATLKKHRVMDPIEIEELGNELQELCDSNPGGTFVIDLMKVEFLSSAVLNRLIVLDKNVKSNEGILAFCGLNPAVFEVFTITKLDLLFKIFETRDSAIDGLQ